MSLVEGIAEALSAADPEHAGDYRERAADYIAELEALDRRIAAAIATIPDDNRMLVVYHDAWTYFARDYGLDMITAVQPADFSEPSASEVRAIIDLIRELGVTVVFGSEVFPTPVLEAIAEETGARYVADLSDDALPGAPGSTDHTYLELMRRNARAVVDGLGGDARLLDD
jgi:ABC-type Zn uptake system ZnuABC Zn-binding protein ZnuA